MTYTKDTLRTDYLGEFNIATSAAFVFALLASFTASIMIVVTQSFHGNFTLDNRPGVQKLHPAPTPRIGDLALLVGAVVGGAFLASDPQRLRWLICISAVPAFRTGPLEDVTKGVSVKMRLLSTIFAAMVSCTLTGYRITSVDIIGIDGLLSSWVRSFVFTAFAIGGIANAMNIIDRVDGLSSGTSITILTGFAVVAGHGGGDTVILGACFAGISALSGFFFLNFPNGLFLWGRRRLYGRFPAGRYCGGLASAQSRDFAPDRVSGARLSSDGDSRFCCAPRRP
ncbi:MAG: hypothetical protein GY701_09380 [Sulfitobacter sp.]|nr:hypothetical protein [Sulfitobacter sp.]